jgi:nitrite reductase (NO-forming)
MPRTFKVFAIILMAALILSACASAVQNASAGKVVEYALTAGIIDGRFTYIGVGGSIDGVSNPVLSAKVGDTVKITLTSDSIEHDISFPDFNATSERVVGKGASTTLSFTVDKGGEFAYFCTIPGHREAGMEGEFNVAGSAVAKVASTAASDEDYMTRNQPVLVKNPPTRGADVVRDPIDLPAPLAVREPETVRLDLEAVEIEGQLSDGTTFSYWTFNGKVPGPFFRVRVGDTMEVHLRNLTNSTMAHSVDFHAVTGPGGGAEMTQTTPGEETTFTAKALKPGLYVYHCATPMVAQHIANGMYGLILVELEEGLPSVDREFYIMQGEVYTKEAFGSTGHLTENVGALLNEDPEYLVFNGAVGSLTTQEPLRAKVGETIRIFFGVGGPNFTSSFHIIGEIFDRVYNQASLTSPVLTDVQTTLVPAGGATVVEFELEVPGNYLLVDHALARMQRGLAGYLIAEGPENPAIFRGTPMSDSEH